MKNKKDSKKHDKAIVKETKKRMKKYSQFSKENYDWDYIHIIELSTMTYLFV